nr:probable multidrug resistance-associated protein lethal(2)03659 isoform X1 [Leptinotarsa decemlineata]XP_023023843.1 probable multidrug resistance-associated protein lethal(2)03659 isoform X1 [Leptinotarsa decemlineata]
MDGTKYSDMKKRKPHPIERGNIFNRIFFCWFFPYLSKGLKREIDEDDMYETRNSQKSEKLGNKLQAAWMVETKKKNPSLMKALFVVFRVELALYGLFNIFTESVKIIQPMLISKLVSFFQPNSPEASSKEIYTYASIIVLSSLMQVMCNHNYQMLVMTLGMKVRVAACSLIYRKSLKLSKTALAETTVGQMVNLLSNDVGRFDFAAQHIHNLWIAPLETVVVMYLLYIYVGPTGLVGTIFLLSFIPFQMYMAKLTSKLRLKTAIRTDERVRLMNEIISGIQVIKMYTWEKPFAKLVDIVRKREIDQIRATSIIRAILMSCSMVLVRGAVYICILTYILTGNTLTATYAYTISSFYGVLQVTVTMFFPQAVIQFAETTVSVKRIQQFLSYDELSNATMIDSGHLLNGVNGKAHIDTKTKEVGIHLKNMSVKWLKSLQENTLENINLEASPKQLVAVVGPVGSGKSTLLHAILKELSPVEGSVSIGGSASYASQEPWLFGASVRQNILFGQKYDPVKYEEVIRVCALQRDFSLFPHGDRTLVGERGVALSGGQRARINLARAVYKEADIYLLDDPLSAVDTHVGKQLFNECICGYLRNKCVILVTHQLQFLRKAHCIYLLEDGEVRSSGTYQELKNSNSDFTKLLEESKEEEKKVERRKLSRIEQTDETDIEEKPVISEEREQRASGIITWYVYRSYLQAGGNWCKTISLLMLFVISQVFGSSTDYFITTWVNLEQTREENRDRTILRVLNDSSLNNTVFSSTSSPVPEYDNTYDSVLTQRTLIIIYSCLVAAVMVVTITRSISFFRYCMAASTRLHNSMFSKIVYSTMRFFNTNPSGRILNRFSKDIGAIDETLPLTIVDTLGIGLSVTGITVVITTVNPWTLIPSVIILTIFYHIRKAFLASSRNIKRVEAITRSPMYTHLTASLQGVTTIRAFGAENILTKEFDNFQDAYTSAYFMFLTANRGFGFWLDMHCVLYVGLVLISILFIQSESFGGNVGLSLTQAMGLSGMFQWGMRQWSELENQMTSVERVQEYADIIPEQDTNTKEPPICWPEAGSIKFLNVFLRYSKEDPPVLKNLVFEIKPREKIGIVGRTGAGKSSLIQALFRLTDIEGSILIDGVDTKTVSLKVLRSKISIIPQEPVLFSGTLRKNLDPFDEYQDEKLWNALEEVELKNTVDELPAGLDSKMAEGGSNFSVGQRQLLCLARAIVRNNKILVLDEATANVDPQTDGLIQSTIRQKFATCTVLTIAHRLHTIMDSDRVLVMDAGQSVEFDHPHSLLQNKTGVFYGLVKQTGQAMAANLQSIAEESYISKTTSTSL